MAKVCQVISKPDVNDARGSYSDSSSGTKSSVANSHDIECRDQIFVKIDRAKVRIPAAWRG